MMEELYKWYPIVDDGEYWTEYDCLLPDEHISEVDKIKTIITDGTRLLTYDSHYLGWSTMAKQGCWKYMRIKIDN